MTAAPFEEGKNDGGVIFLERFDEIVDKRRADERMIYGAEKQSGRSKGKAADGDLNGTELASLPLGVDDDFVWREGDLRGDDIGVRAKNDATHADARVFGDVEQMLKERAALIGKQSFWRAHTARGTARKNYGGEHKLFQDPGEAAKAKIS